MNGVRSRVSATTAVALADPSAQLDALCRRVFEYTPKTVWSDDEGEIELSYGVARLACREGGLHIEAQAGDLASLAYVKLTIVHQLQHVSEDELEIAWEGDGCDSGELPYFRALAVQAARNVSPHMRRLTLKGPDIARFATGGLHVRLVIPPAGVTDPVWPVMGRNGLPSFPQGPNRPDLRTYTVRRIDVARGELDIDIVLHAGDSIGSAFAQRAQPGDPVGVMGPGGGDVEPADWYLLAGDATALPAIARILEELPAGARGQALVEIDDPADMLVLTKPAGVELRWLLRGQAPGLVDAVKAVRVPLEQRCYFWAAAEFADFKALRSYCRDELGLGKGQHLVAAYWRRGLREGERPES